MDWRATVSAVAPTLAAALGGPLAGTAVAALSRALLGRDDASEDEVAEAILRADPSRLADVQLAEMQFRKDIAALDVDLERIAASDRDSARKREMERRDWVPALLAFFTLSGFFGSLAAMLFFAPPEGTQEALYILLGYLGGMASSVVTYYYGSSAGSAAKNQLLAKGGTR